MNIKELTDLEICEYIANLEGKLSALMDLVDSYNKGKVHVLPEKTVQNFYNPLDDDGLIWRLMVKYDVVLEPNHTAISKQWVAECKGQSMQDQDPKRAVCLAIIQSKQPKEPTLETRVFNDLDRLVEDGKGWMKDTYSHYILDDLIASTGEYSKENKQTMIEIIISWKNYVTR